MNPFLNHIFRHVITFLSHENRVRYYIISGTYVFAISYFIPSFIRSFIHSFIHSLIHSFIHSFIHSYVHLFIHLLIHIYNHVLTLSFRRSIDSIHSCKIHSCHFIHSLKCGSRPKRWQVINYKQS